MSLPKRPACGICLILILASSCSSDIEEFVVGQDRFCVPNSNVMRANVAWLPESVSKSGGFNFQTKVRATAASEVLGSVMPKGHFGAFPQPAADSAYVAELRSGKDSIYTATGAYVVVGDTSRTSSVRIWERTTFDAARNASFAIAPELIASCQRYEAGQKATKLLICERAVREGNHDISFSFPYGDLNALPSIEKSVKEQVAGWHCGSK